LVVAHHSAGYGNSVAITIRMLQRLSLIFGFQYSTEEEVTALWLAAARLLALT